MRKGKPLLIQIKSFNKGLIRDSMVISMILIRKSITKYRLPLVIPTIILIFLIGGQSLRYIYVQLRIDGSYVKKLYNLDVNEES